MKKDLLLRAVLFAVFSSPWFLAGLYALREILRLTYVGLDLFLETLDGWLAFGVVGVLVMTGCVLLERVKQ